MLGHASELVKSTFSKASKRLNAIDIGCSLHEFVVAMLDAVMAVPHSPAYRNHASHRYQTRREVKSETRQVACSMKVELTDADRQYLRQLQKQRRDEEGYVKVMVILLLDKGQPASSVADDLGLDDATVYRYAQAWQQLGREKYLLHEARSYWGLLCSAGLAALSREVEQTLYTDVRAIGSWLRHY